MEDRLLTIDDECMSRIVPTLESRNCRSAIREEIHNFSLAFVPPLGTNDNDVFAHDFFAFSYEQ